MTTTATTPDAALFDAEPAETYTAPDSTGTDHVHTRWAPTRYGRTITVCVPRPGRDSLMVAWPEVARLTDARRVRMMREALTLAEHSAATTATDAEVLAAAWRLGACDYLELTPYAIDGERGVSYTTDHSGGSRLADAFAIGSSR